MIQTQVASCASLAPLRAAHDTIAPPPPSFLPRLPRTHVWSGKTHAPSHATFSLPSPPFVGSPSYHALLLVALNPLASPLVLVLRIVRRVGLAKVPPVPQLLLNVNVPK